MIWKDIIHFIEGGRIMRARNLLGKGASLAVGLIMCLSFLFPGAGSFGDERGVEISLSGFLKNYVKMLAGYPGQKKSARKLAGELPEPGIKAPVPASKTIFNWIGKVCTPEHRRVGTEGGLWAEDYIADRFREFGLENVTKEPIDITVWSPRRWSLTVRDAGRDIEIPSHWVINTGFTGPEGITAPMVYVDKGWFSRKFNRKNVEGKIVVANVPFPVFPIGKLLNIFNGGYYLSDPGNTITKDTRLTLIFVRPNFLGGGFEEMPTSIDVYWKAHQMGAAGCIFILSNMPSNSNSHSGPYDGFMKPIPALWVGKYDGEELRELAKKGAEATLVLEGEKSPGITHNVWGILPGRSERMIAIASHHDSPFKGATEDGCGIGMVLAQARAWSRVPEEDRAKSLLFIATTGHFYNSIGCETFARDHEHDLMKRTDLVIVLEHLAARQVREDGRGFAFTGQPALTTVFTSPNKYVIAPVMKVLEEHQLPRTVSLPSNFLMPVPPTDAAGYQLVTGINVVSWITCPYYLLSAEDTLDKIDVDLLSPIADAVSDLVGTYMVMDSGDLSARPGIR
jgi:hypothetical protein